MNNNETNNLPCTSCGTTSEDVLHENHQMCENCYIDSYEYAVDSYINGNISQARELYKELSHKEQNNAIAYALNQNESGFISNCTFDEDTPDVRTEGVKLSKTFDYDGIQILEACAFALENANFHTEAELLRKSVRVYEQEEERYQAELEDIKERGADIPENYGTRQCEHGITITEYDCDCAKCEAGV